MSILPTLARTAATALVGLCLADSLHAQRGMPAPMSSPKARVMQTVGLTEVTVEYHRPGKRGRAVFGSLVPFDQVWRAGANENTTITFSTDVTIEGQPLAAGTYGLHYIPREFERWIVIFSTNSTSWGSYSYTPDEDALRVEVRPEEMPDQSWMSYDFVPLSNDRARLEMRWETVRVPIEIGVDLDATILEETRSVYLRGLAKWNPAAWQQAAQFCLDRKTNLDEAAGWAAEAARLAPSFTTMTLHAQILDELGRGDEAAEVKQRAWSVATEQEYADFGGQLLLAERYADAVSILELGVRRHPGAGRLHERLGEAHRRSGDVDAALRAYDEALARTADVGERERLEGLMAELRGG